MFSSFQEAGWSNSSSPVGIFCRATTSSTLIAVDTSPCSIPTILANAWDHDKSNCRVSVLLFPFLPHVFSFFFFYLNYILPIFFPSVMSVSKLSLSRGLVFGGPSSFRVWRYVLENIFNWMLVDISKCALAIERWLSVICITCCSIMTIWCG